MALFFVVILQKIVCKLDEIFSSMETVPQRFRVNYELDEEIKINA